MVIDNNEYQITVKQKKVKYTNLRIRQNNIIITSSRLMSNEEAIMFINKNIEAVKRLIKKIPQNSLKNNEYLLFGHVYLLKTNSKQLVISNNTIECFDISSIETWAKKIIVKKFEEIQKQYFPQFKTKLIFKNMKTRWGVCYLRKATISLSNAVIHLPLDIVEYIVIHEFCHFKFPNHSHDFYGYVMKYCPDYKKRIKELKKYSYVMNYS